MQGNQDTGATAQGNRRDEKGFTPEKSKEKESEVRTSSNGSSMSNKNVEDRSGAVVTALRDNASEFATRASDITHKAQEYGEQALEQASTYIKKNPAQAILAGFGVGVLIGFVLNRRG